MKTTWLMTPKQRKRASASCCEPYPEELPRGTFGVVVEVPRWLWRLSAHNNVTKHGWSVARVQHSRMTSRIWLVMTLPQCQ